MSESKPGIQGPGPGPTNLEVRTAADGDSDMHDELASSRNSDRTQHLMIGETNPSSMCHGVLFFKLVSRRTGGDVDNKTSDYYGLYY
jgi:hypothetical protein